MPHPRSQYCFSGFLDIFHRKWCDFCMVKTKGIDVLIFAAIRTLGRRSIRHMRNCFHRPPRTRYLSRNRRDGVPFAPQRQRKVQNRPSGPTLPSLKRLPASFSGPARLMFSKGNKSPCSASTGAMACATKKARGQTEPLLFRLGPWQSIINYLISSVR